MISTTVFQDAQNIIWQTRDFIVDQAIDEWKKGRDAELIIENKCKLFNIEFFLVYDHFKECVRFLSLETVTVK